VADKPDVLLIGKAVSDKIRALEAQGLCREDAIKRVVESTPPDKFKNVIVSAEGYIPYSDKRHEQLLDEYEFGGDDSFERHPNEENRKPRDVRRKQMIAWEKALCLMPPEYVDTVLGALQWVASGPGCEGWEAGFRERAHFMCRVIQLFQWERSDTEDDGKRG